MLEFLMDLALKIPLELHFRFPSTFLFGEHDFPEEGE